MERICIFIDGSNFYHLVLKKLGILEHEFNFDAFAEFLSNGRKINSASKRFYTGTIRERIGDERSKKAMARQTKLFTILKSHNWEIKTNKLRVRMEEINVDERVINYEKLKAAKITTIQFERLREKGIDVKIATDLIAGAVDDKYDTAVLVSSDTDLVPAVDWVRYRMKKKIEYVGFSIPDKKSPKDSTKPLHSMISKTDIQRTLIESDIRKFAGRYT